jgi:hypothetical protein
MQVPGENTCNMILLPVKIAGILPALPGICVRYGRHSVPAISLELPAAAPGLWSAVRNISDAISTSKITNKTDFQLKKQRLSNLHKGELSKPKPAKVTTFLPESQRVKIPFIIKQIAKDGNCLFRSILAAQGLNDSSHLGLRSRCADSVVAE